MDIFNIFIQKDNKNRLMKNKMQFGLTKDKNTFAKPNGLWYIR
jgi:hypothetical protein